MSPKLIGSIVTVWTLAVVGFAAAQTQTATPPEVTPPSSTPGVGTGSQNQGLDQAETKAADQAKPELEAIRTRAKTLPAKENVATERKLDAEIKEVNTDAAKAGSRVADRLAKEFSLTPGAIEAERTQFNAGFGELMIAHLLLANQKSTSTMTIGDIFKLHQDGMGWGQIAHGMGLRLGDLVSAARTDARIATGKAKADTKTPRIRPEGEHVTMEHGKSAASSGHKVGGGATGMRRGK